MARRVYSNMLTTKDGAQVLRVSSKTVLAYCARKDKRTRLKSYRFGRGYRFEQKDMEAFKKNCIHLADIEDTDDADRSETTVQETDVS